MELSSNDIKLLKEATKVNTQVWIPSSGDIGIVDNEKTLAAYFSLDSNPSKDIGCYDLAELLSILGLYKDATITEGETELEISDGKGKKTNYRYTSKDCIVMPPSKEKFEEMLSSVKDSVEVPQETISAVKEHATVLKAPHVILEGSQIIAKDDENPSSNSVTFDIAGAKFPRTVLLRENFIKIVDDGYTIRTDGKRTELKAKSGKVTYYTSRVTSQKKETPKTV